MTACKRDEKVAPAPVPPRADQHQIDLAKLPSAGSLADQLAAEGAARSHDAETPTLEGLKGVLTTQGYGFGQTLQLMGRAHLALYCASARALNGVDLTVCEYPSADQAARGEAESNVAMAKMAGHKSRVSRKSVLHVVAPSTVTAEEVAKIFAAFDALPQADAGG